MRRAARRVHGARPGRRDGGGPNAHGRAACDAGGERAADPRAARSGVRRGDGVPGLRPGRGGNGAGPRPARLGARPRRRMAARGGAALAAPARAPGGGARPAHRRAGRLGVPRGHRTVVPAHPHPGGAGRGARDRGPETARGRGRAAPGAMSGVVRSPFGFHIIRRPALAEVRDSFRAGLEHARGARLDSAYLDSLAAARALRVEQDAPKRLREALARIVAARTDPHPLATFRGGAFRVQDFALWALALDPTEVRTIAAGDDSLVAAFVRALAQRAVVLAALDGAGVPLAPADWERVRADHDSTIARLEQLTGLTPQLLRDSAASVRDRMTLAMARVDRYLDRSIVEGAVPFVPVSPFLAAALRAGEPWALDEAGL